MYLPFFANRIDRARDARIQAESQLANQLQRKEPGLSRTAALKAAKRMVAKVDFRDGRVHTISVGTWHAGEAR